MPRKSLPIACLSLLLLSLLPVPVQAVETATVFHFNAIPGVKVDICTKAVPVASGLRYGRFRRKEAVSAGPATVTVRLAAASDCKGTRLAGPVPVAIEAGKNYTFVYWRPLAAVKVKVFENDLTLAGEGGVTLTMRHMAKADPIDVWAWQQVVKPAEVDYPPTFDDLGKGRSSRSLDLIERQTLIEAFPATNTQDWTYEYAWDWVYANKAYQAYFIGNPKVDYRIVVIGQDGTTPPLSPTPSDDPAS